jgi:hypothetical protein
MDQQPTMQPAASSFVPQPRNPAFPPPPSKSKVSILSIIACGLALLAILGLIGAYVITNDNAAKQKSDQTLAVAGLTKRLKLVEDATRYTEEQVDKNRFQAVFINGGQVYFGKITKFTETTMKLEDIYYLKTGSVDKSGNPTTTDASLVKLGNELHAPEDVMFIERKNLLFWENLKNEGQVAKAIVDYQNSHP